MAQRSTRNKIRFQVDAALEDLRKGQNHLGLIAALAEDQSDYINDNLPILMATMETVIDAIDVFGGKL